MEIDDHLEALRREGELLIAAATRSGPDAAVPTCPGWVVRDLVHHMGGIMRWAGTTVAGRLAERLPPGPERDRAVGPMPTDECLVPWFRESHAGLLETLRSAPDDLDCWRMFGTLTPKAFWARRQAHETAIHRVDAETAAGDGLSPVPADFALDGIDELLAGVHSLPRSRMRTEKPALLLVRADEGGAPWYVHLSADPPRVEREGTAVPDCTVTGPAQDLYLALWNRTATDVLDVAGDASLLDLWRERSAV
ncbi:maleylpyruvate isomerase family mycothiol-dependent enzyme [Streptomyces capparidis]